MKIQKARFNVEQYHSSVKAGLNSAAKATEADGSQDTQSVGGSSLDDVEFGLQQSSSSSSCTTTIENLVTPTSTLATTTPVSTVSSVTPSVPGDVLRAVQEGSMDKSGVIESSTPATTVPDALPASNAGYRALNIGSVSLKLSSEILNPVSSVASTDPVPAMPTESTPPSEPTSKSVQGPTTAPVLTPASISSSTVEKSPEVEKE